MKNIQEYIDSGILELFVFGNLSETEQVEVAALVEKHPELKKEVEQIEAAVMMLSSATLSKEVPDVSKILSQLAKKDEKEVIPLSRKREQQTNDPQQRTATRPRPWQRYLQVAAAILLLATLGFLIGQNQKLKDQIVDIQQQQSQQQSETQVAQEQVAAYAELLKILRDDKIRKIPLGPQAVAPEAYASVYWDSDNEKAYVDINGLPEPPEGKVYQVWSLTLDPLTPTSLGVLDGEDISGSRIYALDNPNQSQAFGITLEPEGGSTSPTLDQLYTLGTVAP